MRLRRLNLERYGRFTDHCIDFGERPESGPDLHIIYGPNEAGKSTSLNAFLDLLFGIEPRSRYNFIHPYSSMRIRASLELSTGARNLSRVRRGLLDDRDQAIADGVILGELGGINRDAYRAMFSLDDETLEAGGESILASKGELGQLLFSASAGLAEMSRSLTGLRGEADGFYKFKARSGDLSEMKKELASLKEERDRIDTLASEYARLIEVRDRTAGQYDEVIVERGRIRARMDAIQRHLNALPRLTALRALREQLAPLESLPEVPLGWREALPDLQKDDVSLATRAAGIDADIQRISSELDAMVLDEPALEVVERLEGLSLLKARHETADKDLPDRRLKLGDIKRSITGLLARLGRPDEEDPHRLVLAASSVGTLRDLLETRSGIEASVDAAKAELSQARERHDEAEEALRAAGGDVGTTEAGKPGLGLLAGTVATLRSGDHAARQREASRSMVARKEILGERLASLRPWQGSADDLSALTVPSSDALGRIGATLTAASEQKAVQSGAVDRLDRERRRLEVEIASMKTVAGVVTDGEAAEVRAERERTWAEHRRRLDGESADLFEAALRRDDLIAEGHLRHGKEAAELQQALRRLAVLDEDLRQAREQLVDATGRRQDALDELVATIIALSSALPGVMTIDELETWLGLRDRALEARAELKQAERILREADVDAETARTTLQSALDMAGLSYAEAADYATLTTLAQRALDRETSLEGLRSAVKVSIADVRARERAFEKASAADEVWQAKWTQACAICWFGEEGATPAVSTVREVLEVLAALAPALEQQLGLTDRIAKMESDQGAFETEVVSIATAIGLPIEGTTPMRLAGLVQARVQEARDAVSAAQVIRASLDASQGRQRSISQELTVHQVRKVEMTAFFGVDTLAEVARKMQETERKSGLSAQAEAAEQEILEAVRVGTITEAEIVLDTADRSGLEAEFSQLQSHFEDKDQRAQDLFAERRDAESRVDAVGGDDAVARIEERRRTTLLAIEEKAERYLRLRLGVLAAVHALRAYRDQHRGSMMTRASEAFRTISRSSYTGLATQPDDDHEILVALSSDGGSKVASELSKGTRFQLYLALRVAGYHEFARTRRPVPFVADDIMETFDDFRAEEAFGLFAGMAEVGQVIYLTHHRHLCAIAKKICPSVRVHELDGVR